MIINNIDKEMKIDKETYLADNITLIGEIETERNVSIWYGSVIRGDNGKIIIKENSAIEDNTIIHGKVSIGKNCIIGHNAIIHGCTIEDNVLIGMGAIIMDGAIIKEGSVIGAGSLISKNTIVEKNNVYVGNPGKFVRETNEKDKLYLNKSIEKYLEFADKQLKKYGG